jgi:hypothetical protein
MRANKSPLALLKSDLLPIRKMLNNRFDITAFKAAAQVYLGQRIRRRSLNHPAKGILAIERHTRRISRSRKNFSVIRGFDGLN